jgi:hypothetical protein
VSIEHGRTRIFALAHVRYQRRRHQIEEKEEEENHKRLLQNYYSPPSSPISRLEGEEEEEAEREREILLPLPPLTALALSALLQSISESVSQSVSQSHWSSSPLPLLPIIHKLRFSGLLWLLVPLLPAVRDGSWVDRCHFSPFCPSSAPGRPTDVQLIALRNNLELMEKQKTKRWTVFLSIFSTLILNLAPLKHDKRKRHNYIMQYAPGNTFSAHTEFVWTGRRMDME